MSELRQDPTTREWVIIAPERAKRPIQHHAKRKLAEELPEWDEACPFCPGNEDRTPPEVFRFPQTKGITNWEVRVTTNRFAALKLNNEPLKDLNDTFFHRRPGIGVHEVIIESPSHNMPMALMSYEQVEKILIVYKERYNSLKKNPLLKFITIFKNHGQASGTSLVHPHSQLVAMPLPAPSYLRRFNVAINYYSDIGHCLYCDLVERELTLGERIVAKTKEFVVLHPYASRVPWETWIIPKKHNASFGMFPDEYLSGMARVLKDSLYCMYRGLGNPAYNFMIDTTVTEDEEDPYYHWHLRIVPRTNLIAGFEMGSGIYISTALPEETSKRIKEMANSLPESECPTYRDNT